MGRHIAGHVKKSKELVKCYTLKIYSDSFFWFYLQVPQSYTLDKLDAFLRDVWLECCGHLSCFTIKNTRYSSHPDESGYEEEKSTECKVSSVLEKGLTFTYEYDYGTTTSLNIKVVMDRGLPVKTRRVPRVLAVHEPVEFLCDKCHGPAQQVCGFCTIYEDGGLLCDTCTKSHQCYIDEGEDSGIMLPITQSPRVGLCGYTGPASVYDHADGLEKILTKENT